jgi:hypothetical protein
LESRTSSLSNSEVIHSSNWFRLGAAATISAFAAGLAAAWWYRSTLKKLRLAEEIAKNPQFGIPEDDLPDQA